MDTTPDLMPMDTSRDLFHFTDGALAYAGYHVHPDANALHTHSFVEIAFAVGGEGIHNSLTGRRQLRRGDVVLLRPGVWHGYDQCRNLELYNCCFSSELLRHELAWTREDPLLGYLLWTGPYSVQRRGLLSISLDPGTLDECLQHLSALDGLGRQPTGTHRGDIVGRLSLLLSHLARSVAQAHRLEPAGPAHPAVGQAMRLLEASIAYRWTLTELAEQLHVAPGYLIRLFKSATGLPPMAYLGRLRAETAAALLLHSDRPITCIARDVGWPDQNYFARRFKAHYGLSASTYRARFANTAAFLHHPAESMASTGVGFGTPVKA
jgi:AraC family L-rhamnose operon transcriptional activator RhaR